MIESCGGDPCMMHDDRDPPMRSLNLINTIERNEIAIQLIPSSNVLVGTMPPCMRNGTLAKLSRICHLLSRHAPDPWLVLNIQGWLPKPVTAPRVMELK